MELINITRAYKAHQVELLDQKKQLQREQQYAADLKTLRTTRQHKVLKKYGLMDDKTEGREEGTTG